MSKLGTRFKSEFGARIIALASGTTLVVLLARMLDPTGYGLLFLAISVAGTAQLFCKVGIAKSAARHIAQYKETDPGQLKHILSFSFLLNTIAVLLMSLLFFYSREHIAVLIGEPSLEPFLLTGVLFIALGTFHFYARVVLQGYEAIAASSFLKAVNSVARLAFALGFVLLGYGALGAFFGYVLAFGISSLIGIIYLYDKYYYNVNYTEREVGIRKKIASYSIPVTVANMGGVLDKRVDTLLVAFFLSPTAVGYYTISKQIVEHIQTPISALGFTLAPTFEGLNSSGNRKKAAALYEKALSQGLLLYIPGSAGLILVAEPMIKLVFGTEYLGAVPVVQSLAIYAIFYSSNKVTSLALDFLGRAKNRAIAQFLTAVMNVILNIILIPAIGVVGAAHATVITYSIYSLYNFYIISSELNVDVVKVAKNIFIISLITIAMAGTVYLFVDHVTGFLTLFVTIASGILIWGILSVLSGILDYEIIIEEVL
ncbi:flippase [Halorussus salinisoli]|uniref:flippase n=1 Tax=Halorussus salinisoli TaxID=2558242 RepID=UPI0010C16ACB|nr:flippase [Halorussus salinisoli]